MPYSMMKSFPCYESITEEPIAGKPHDGFCEEGSAQWGASLTRRGVKMKNKRAKRMNTAIGDLKLLVAHYHFQKGQILVGLHINLQDLPVDLYY